MKFHAGNWSAIILLISAIVSHPVEAAPRPNIVFLLSDDHRFDTIRALGNAEIQTPHLDRLVTNGFTFTHTAIMGGGQGAVCIPSRAMLLTGRTLFRATTTYTGNIIPADAVTWPEAFRASGYDTFGIGKWHNDKPSFARSFKHGGPIFFGGMSDHSRISVHDFDPTGTYHPTNARIATTFSTELFSDAAVKFLERRGPRDKPFALYVAYTAPHDPRTPPRQFADQYSPADIRLPANFRPQHPFDNGDLAVRDEMLLPTPRTAEAVRREIALYYGMISHLDAQVGRILNTLSASGLAGNTIVVFAGDNGLAVGRHGLLGKQNLYEHSVRVPLILSGSGLPRGKRSDALCYLLDVMPTLCELASVPVPESSEGLSLVGVMQGGTNTVRRELFAAYRSVQRSVRDARWKLIEYPEAKITQLFDLDADSNETNNLVENHKFEPELRRFRALLSRAQADLGDPLGTQSPSETNPTAVRATPAQSIDQAMKPMEDVPGLPRVLLIGDSISMNYTAQARKRLKGVANVHRIPANGATTTNGLANINEWIGTNRWDVIHFNWGLHDLKLDARGNAWVPLPEYQAALERLVLRLKQTGARLVWASTTPVPRGRLKPVRRSGDEVRYNEAAAEIMQRHGIAMNDLYFFARPRLARIQLEANVHFTAQGNELLGEQVAQSIREELGHLGQ